MSPEAQTISDQIRQIAQAKSMDPLDLLRLWLDRDRTETELRLSKHERKLRLASA